MRRSRAIKKEGTGRMATATGPLRRPEIALLVVLCMALSVLFVLAPAGQAEAAEIGVWLQSDTLPDGVEGELRYAVNQANASPGPENVIINFEGITGNNITLNGELPPLNNPHCLIDIQGETCPDGYVEIIGPGVGNGLVFQSGQCKVSQVHLHQFTGHGIHIQGGANILKSMKIEDCAGDGVRITGGGNNELRSCSIVGNQGNGITIEGSNGNNVESCGVGWDLWTESPCANGVSGVVLQDGAAQNHIGPDSETRNTLSYNGYCGVEIFGSETADNHVHFNYIGTGPGGYQDFGNMSSGVYVYDGAHDNEIGTGVHNTFANVISGNSGQGVEIAGGSYGNRVRNNHIGVTADGMQPQPNEGGGVSLRDYASSNIIGGNTESYEGNVISGNGAAGVTLVGEGTDENQVTGNWIGCDRYEGAVANNGDGVCVINGPCSNYIGGQSYGEHNVIRHNSGNGILIFSDLGSRTHSNFAGANCYGENGGLAIDLESVDPCPPNPPAGPNSPPEDYPYDAEGSSNLPNDSMQMPVIEECTTQNVGGTAVPDTMVALFYTWDDPTGFGEGSAFIESENNPVPVDGEGDWDSGPVGVTPGDTVCAVGFDPTNYNISEFSGYQQVIAAGPWIDYVDPGQAPEGAWVTIWGQQLGTGPDTDSYVEFNGTRVNEYNGWSNDSINVAVPGGATSGDIVVYQNGEVSNGYWFEVLPEGPYIQNMEPWQGPTGREVEIYGYGFGADQAAGYVEFNEVQATNYTDWQDGYICVTVPDGATSGDVLVHQDGLTSNGWWFEVNEGPWIDYVDPWSGPEGCLVTVHGYGFGEDGPDANTYVEFDKTSATAYDFWSDEEIGVFVPAGAGSGDVVVCHDGNVSNGCWFEVNNGPYINNMYPASGPVGTVVTLEGYGFGPDPDAAHYVEFNGTPAAFYDYWDDTRIEVPVPQGASSGDVAVYCDGVYSNWYWFEVTGSQPCIDDLDPPNGAAGDLVTIWGSGFGENGPDYNSYVEFNGTEADSYGSWADGQIEVYVPGGATSGDVYVYNDGYCSNGWWFDVGGPAPAISSIEPERATGGVDLFIEGKNFGDGAASEVYIGKEKAEVESWEDGRIVAEVPRKSVVGYVAVATPNGVAEDEFDLYPNVVSIEPHQSAQSGVFVARIGGTNFDYRDNGADLSTWISNGSRSFGGAILGEPSYDRLSAAFGLLNAPQGLYDVYVRNDDTGETGVLKEGFRVGEAPPPPPASVDVRITSPPQGSYPDDGGAAGAGDGGGVEVKAKASSNRADIRTVDFYIDGEKKASDTEAPYGFSWNFGEEENGTHRIVARAYDEQGNSGESVPVEVYRNRIVPNPSRDWFLAEGSTAWGFETYVLVENPGESDASVGMEFMSGEGEKAAAEYTVPARSRFTVCLNDVVPDCDVSTRVTADVPVVVERSMYWGDRQGGHDSIGVTASGPSWHFAEGTTAWGFETWYLVANTGDETAEVEVELMKGDGSVESRLLEVPPGSRKSVNAADIVRDADVSATIESVGGSDDIVCERSMYWKDRVDGHETIGVTESSLSWYFAEGVTGYGFETFILIGNAGGRDALVTVDFLPAAGEAVGREFEVPAHSRRTVNVNEVIPGSEVATRVTSDVPVIAERAVYWDDRNGGHGTIGSPTPADDWMLAEGCTDFGFETWVLIQNPSATSRAEVELRLLRNGAEVRSFEYTVPPVARYSVSLNELTAEAPGDVSVEVVSDIPVVAERSMYWGGRVGGHASVGCRALRLE